MRKFQTDLLDKKSNDFFMAWFLVPLANYTVQLLQRLQICFEKIVYRQVPQYVASKVGPSEVFVLVGFYMI